MILSTTEREYLYDSLVRTPPIRPDARSQHQYRPLEAKTSFLPGSNGSARIRLLDGSESIVSIKSKVVATSQEPSLIEVDVDVAGHRSDSNFVSNLKYNLTTSLTKNFPMDSLKLTSKYTFKLYIDCIVTSHSSYPLSIISLSIYLALKTTKLPLLISEQDDEQIEEQPTFSDDWDMAKSLNFDSDTSFQPPIFVTIGIVGKSLLFDPSIEEESVLENGLTLSFLGKHVILPVNNINLAFSSNNLNFKGIEKETLLRAIKMCNEYCGYIINALETLIKEDEVESNNNIF